MGRGLVDLLLTPTREGRKFFCPCHHLGDNPQLGELEVQCFHYYFSYHLSSSEGMLRGSNKEVRDTSFGHFVLSGLSFIVFFFVLGASHLACSNDESWVRFCDLPTLVMLWLVVVWVMFLDLFAWGIWHLVCPSGFCYSGFHHSRF